MASTGRCERIPLPKNQPSISALARIGDGLETLVLHHGPDVVLQIGPDAGNIGLDRDAVLAQMIGGADSRQHQEVRRLVRTGGNDDLARAPHHARLALLKDAHAHGASLFDDEPQRLGVGQHMKIRPPARRPQISDRR